VPEAGRVITGSAGGLRLEAPGKGTRPLSDRVKQALFGMIEAELGDAWERSALDLFAGSGAAGIEALSRGAPAAVLVERDGRAAAVIAANLRRTRLGDRGIVVRRDVPAWLASGAADVAAAPFGVVVVDPPYDQPVELGQALERLGRADLGWLDTDACVVAKHFWKDVPPAEAGELFRSRDRRFGETALSVYRRGPEPDSGGD
jgi:16S rRNA (guanine966-N2)-methyltransferase